MSFRVLVIPEDFRKDQFILKPIIEALFRDINKVGARIEICLDPLLGGVNEALKWEKIEEIIGLYPMVDLFLLCVDRDGKSGRRDSLDAIERSAQTILSPNRRFYGECAWQELEVWILAGLTLPADWKWNAIREEANPKELYYAPLAASRKLTDLPAGGRKILAEEAAKSIKAVRLKCHELDNLGKRI